MARIQKPSASEYSSQLVAIGVVLALLYFAQEVLIPVALSMMLAFLLAPLATRIERAGAGRVISVLLVVGVAFSVIAGLGWVVGSQIVRLAEDLPQYRDEIVKKAAVIQGSQSTLPSTFERLGQEIQRAAMRPAPAPTTSPTTTPSVVSNAVNQVGSDPIREAAREAVGGAPTTAATQPGLTPANPLFTSNVQSPASPIRTLFTYLGLVLGPLGTGALVLIFVIFVLLQREDLRDRLIRLVSRGRYTVTTRALNDAGTRISKFMLAQAMVNGSYGAAVSLGLWIIGLTFGGGTTFPSFVLWGLLCSVLRFIPYVGPWLAAAFPLTLSLAVYSGFHVFIATASLLIVIELISNNVIETWLYGTSTGISSVALLVAAVFWTWLWGPVGLLLSTPLTVCIVVLGKYVPQLEFLDVLLGDKPALPPAVGYYQRLLAGDRTEAFAIASEVEKAGNLCRVSDEVLIPALMHVRRDRRDNTLEPAVESLVYDATREFVERLPMKTGAGGDLSSGAPQVFGLPAHHRSEELVAGMLALALREDGIRADTGSTRMLPSDVVATVEKQQPAVVFIAVIPPSGLVQCRFLCRTLRKRFPDLKIIVGYWGRVKNFDQLLVKLRASGASYVNTSLQQSRSQIESLLRPRDAGLPGPKPVLTAPKTETGT